MPVMFHYTDQAGYNAIKATVDWCFHARQPPPRDHPVGAYFTILPPTTGKLAKRLRIPARKVEYFFSFTAGNELKPLMAIAGITFIIFLSVGCRRESSIEICVALWRILCGASILGLTYRYQREKESVIELELQPLRGGVPDKYKSESRDDFRILAELRMVACDGKPHLIGAFRPVD